MAPTFLLLAKFRQKEKINIKNVKKKGFLGLSFARIRKRKIPRFL
jgi:hypothetical protein